MCSQLVFKINYANKPYATVSALHALLPSMEAPNGRFLLILTDNSRLDNLHLFMLEFAGRCHMSILYTVGTNGILLFNRL